VQRISVVGNSGSGKTTLAGQLASALAIPHLELDAVFHQPDWQPLAQEAFQARVAAFVAGQAWVVDGNYGVVRGIVWDRADTVIILDPPRGRIMRQVIYRTLRRMATRTELWNGNREPWSNLFRLDPEKSIIAWAWTSHHRTRERFLAAQYDPAYAHLRFIRLSTRSEVAEFMQGHAAHR
jgi:adenylate kinase family enzyme